MAKAANIPFYAVVESYKFVRIFPLNQYDLPSNVSGTLLFSGKIEKSSHEEAAYLEVFCLRHCRHRRYRHRT